jgi:cysteine synthase
VGRTPLVRIGKIVKEDWAEVLCKLESFNPTHSVKDRVAVAMIEDAEREGKLDHDMFVVEPTSGNTGIGLAMVCAAKGYRLIIVMPENMSEERRRLMRAWGAELVLTPADEGMRGAVVKAEEILKADKTGFMPQQFKNPSNPRVHMLTTAREILEEIDQLDAFVAGVGTGGTVSGVGRVLKRQFPDVMVVAVEPSSSPLLSEGRAGPHQIQGIGANFIPGTLDMEVVDSVICVSEEEAKTACRRLAREEGILSGISSGAAFHASLQLAKKLGNGKRVLTLLPDDGERYLSTDLFEE